MQTINMHQAVWFDERRRRGFVVGIDGMNVLLLGVSRVGNPEGIERWSAVGIEPLPIGVCIFCGESLGFTPEQEARARAKAEESFGMPSFKSVMSCSACAPVLMEMSARGQVIWQQAPFKALTPCKCPACTALRARQAGPS